MAYQFAKKPLQQECLYWAKITKPKQGSQADKAGGTARQQAGH